MRKQDNLPCLLCYNIFIVKSLHMLFRIFSNQFSCIVILTQNLDLVIKNVYHLLFRLCEIHVLLLFLIHQSFIHESKLLPWPTQFRFISHLSQNLGHLDIRLRNLLLLCRVFPLYIKMWCLFLNSDVRVTGKDITVLRKALNIPVRNKFAEIYIKVSQV